jgi:hypothetical protein
MSLDFNPTELSDKTKNILVSVGFSEEEADNQMRDLAEIITSAFSQKISDKSQLDNPDETRRIFYEVATPIVDEYLKEISKSLNDDEKKKLLDQLNALSEK